MALRPLVVLIAIAAALVGAYRYFFPTDEAQIRAVLERIAEAVSSGPAGDGEVSRLARAASVRRQLDPQISLDAGPPLNRMSGREAIIGSVARLNSTLSDLDVQFDDVAITVGADRTTAHVHLTAEARYRDGSGRAFDARELDVTMRKVDGDWVVASVALVRTLEPLAPQ